MSKSVMLPAFESIQSMLFPFMHDRVAGLHSWAAKRIVQIFLQLEDNFFDGRLVHVGAGFGGDMQEAYRQGIKQRIGLEKDPRQIALSSLLPTLSEVELLNYLTQDKVITTLYAPEVIAEVARAYCREQENNDPNLVMFLCDVRDEKSLFDCLRLHEGIFNGLIGSIMMHWLVQGGYPLHKALDTLGKLLCTDNLAIFSVPFHFTELDDPKVDEELRAQCMPDTEFYKVFTKTVITLLKRSFNKVEEGTFRKVPSLLMKESELKAGSSTMEFIGSIREWCGRSASIDRAMAGFGTYEVSLRTGQPAATVAPFVAEAIRVTKEQVGISDSSGTYVTFYTYRRR